MLPNMATKNKRKRRKEGRKCQKVTERERERIERER
jgi:hypothetical protein